MTVLLVSGDFTTWGGMDRANYELAWYLAEHAGVAVRLIAHQVAGPLVDHPRVSWRRVPRPLNSCVLGSPLLAHYGRAEACAVQARGGSVIVNGGNCPWPGINWAHVIQREWQPRLAHAPAYIRARQWLSRRDNLQTETHAFRLATTVVANSEQTRTGLIEDFGLPAQRVHTIYFGTDPQVFHPASHTEKLAARQHLGWPTTGLIAIFVGTLGYDRNKGFDVLFEAWRKLCADAAWDVDLMAVGAGADAAYWKRQAATAGLSQRVRILGFSREIPKILRAADVFVHPAFYEAYGLSVHEALCCGIPALVTRTAGVAERYPSALEGLLLDHPPSVVDLVDRLRRWRGDLQGNRDRVQNFSVRLRQRTWADMAQEFIELTMPPLANLPDRGSGRQIVRRETAPDEAALPISGIRQAR